MMGRVLVGLALLLGAILFGLAIGYGIERLFDLLYGAAR